MVKATKHSEQIFLESKIEGFAGQSLQNWVPKS